MREIWQTVKVLEDGEFRVRNKNGRCFLEQRVNEPEDVTKECTADFHMGTFSCPGAYIRLLHNGKVIGMVSVKHLEPKDPDYEFKAKYPDNFSFQVLKK